MKYLRLDSGWDLLKVMQMVRLRTMDSPMTMEIDLVMMMETRMD